MLKRFWVYFALFSVVFPVFSATQQSADSGSSQLGKPSVKFKSWKVGRSPEGTDTTSKEQKSFITSTEEVCYFRASVVYDGNQGDSVSPIDPSKVTWSVEKPSHGMQLVESEKHWSGAKHPSKLDPSTSGQQETLSIGETIDSWRVIEIHPKEVILQRNGERLRLHLATEMLLN